MSEQGPVKEPRRNKTQPDKDPAEQKITPFDPHIWMWMALFFSAYYLVTSDKTTGPEKLAYSEFKQAVERNEVSEVTFRGDQIHGRLRAKPEQRFVTVVPGFPDETLLPLLEGKGVRLEAETATEPRWLTLLLGLLPWLFIAAFFIYSMRMVQQRISGGAQGGLFGFGKSRARLFEHNDNDVSYADVAGLDSAKQELTEIIEFLQDPEKFRRLGAKMPRGILLMGPPGTGKTLLAKATANEAGVPFFSISGSEFIEMYVGVGASRVRDMFKEARERAPALIFVDEIDSVGRVRGTGVGGGHDEREQTLNQILAEMDGFTRDEPVVVLAATNRPDVLDAALTRPGRFDRKVVLELPQSKARKEILIVHLKQVPQADDIRLDELAALTVGFSGADLANLVNEAALLAARNNEKQVCMQHFTSAHDKVVMGSERPDLMNPAERHRTATHESGHALVAYLLPESDPLHQVSIIPRGSALGATEQLPVEDRHNYPQPYVETRLAVLLAGRAAEQLVLNSISSGAADDLTQATHLAKLMVTQWGMSDVVGPVHFKAGSEHPFLGYELTNEKDFSEESAAKIDQEVRRFIQQAEETALATLGNHRQALDVLIENLDARETLQRHDIDLLLQDLIAAPEQPNSGSG